MQAKAQVLYLDLKMASTVKDVIDIDFDPDLLTSYLEKLSLETTIPELKDCLNVLDNDQAKVDLEVGKSTAKSKNECFKIKQELKSDSENENYKEYISKAQVKVETPEFELPNKKKFFSSKQESYNLHDKNISAKNFVKCETSSDSDEESPSLHERGGPERTKRRPSKKRQYQKPIRIKTSDLNQQSLKFLSSGYIIQNQIQPTEQQSILNQPFTNIDDYSQFHFLNTGISNNDCITNSENLFFTNQSNLFEQFTQNNTSSVSESTFLFQDQSFDNFNLYSNNTDIENKNLYTYSPESGYDTSPPSNTNSPSPCLTENQLYNSEENDESKEIQAIIDSIIELENATISSKSFKQNVPKLDIQELKNFLKESTNESVEDSPETFINFEHSYEEDFLTALQNEPLQNPGSECVNVPLQKESSYNHINQLQSFINLSSQALGNSKQRKLSFELKDTAKYKLRFSEDFDVQKYAEEQKKLLERIKQSEQNGDDVKIIDLDKDSKSINFKRTNLHNAVLSANIEKVYCLVEAQKKYNLSLFDINTRDARGKTALDYAEKEKLPLIFKYLEENNGVKGI